jgi:hypothetical protein
MNSVYETVLAAMTRIGGDAALLDERCIMLSWSVMEGLVIIAPEGQITIKVYTPWSDADSCTVERAEDIPDKVIDLFQNFWNRRRAKRKE